MLKSKGFIQLLAVEAQAIPNQQLAKNHGGWM
jgi:hypothetical protein